MKRISALVIFCLAFPGVETRAQDSLMFPVSTPSLRIVPNSAFRAGERLVFDVGYSFFTAGEAVFEVPDMDTVNGRPSYRVLFTVNSTPSFSWIYRVEDRYETIIDEQGLFPWRFSQKIREGKFSRDFEAEFDQINNIARTSEGDYPIPPYVQDIVSAFYFTRTIDFTGFHPGQKVLMENFYKDTTHTLAIKYLGRQEISVDAGTFKCIIVEPLIQQGGLFKSDGRVLIWMTDDERKIPVKVDTKVLVGSIVAELREYSGIAGPIVAKTK